MVARMEEKLIKMAVRSMFLLTGRGRAQMQMRTMLEKYTKLAETLSRDERLIPVEVPPMRGVDEDMRNWSFDMILEHNRIVNQSISAAVQQLARGEPLSGAAVIDQKTEVMPSPNPDGTVLEQFQDSVTDHLTSLKTLGRLRGTRAAPHSIFGEFDAHQWNCMLAFHLKLHFNQASHVVKMIIQKRK